MRAFGLVVALLTGCSTMHVIDTPGTSRAFTTFAILCGRRGKLTNYSLVASGCERGLIDAGKRTVPNNLDTFHPLAGDGPPPRFYEALARQTGADAFVVCNGGGFEGVWELGDLTLALVDPRTGTLTRTVFFSGNGSGFAPHERARQLCQDLVSP